MKEKQIMIEQQHIRMDDAHTVFKGVPRSKMPKDAETLT